MFLVCLFFLCPTVAGTSASGSSSSSIDIPSLRTPIIARATSSIIASAYVPVSSQLSIMWASTESQCASRHQLGFINEVMRNSTGSIMFTIETPDHITARRLRYFNVLFVDGYAAFRLIYRSMNESCFDFTGLYTIVLTESSRYQYETIALILQDCWALQIVNVVVLVSIHPQARTAVYTYFPYTQFHCGVVAPVILNYFVANGFMYDRAFFPHKMGNMWGCPIWVAAYVFVPYMLLDKLEPPDERGYVMDGIDGITVRVLSQRLNFTPIVRVNDVGRGQIFRNGTATGAFRLVLNGEANMTIGAIAFTADHLRWMSSSTPYYQAPILFAVPKGRNYTAFETLFMPFHTTIWFGTMALFALTAVLFALLRHSGNGQLSFVVGVENRTPFVNMLAVYMGSYLTDAMPVRNFARFMLMVWTLGCLVLRNSYQGALFHHLQAQRLMAPIELLDDLIAANYSLRMHRPLFALFENMPKTEPYLAPTIDENNMRDFDLLIAEPQAGDVYLTTKLSAGFYNTHHRNSTVLLSHEQLFILPMVIYFRKHSCLTHAIDSQIIVYQMAGLINKWLTNFYDDRVLRMDRRAAESGGTHGPLHLGQVSGAFQMCAYMLVLPVLVLLAEMLAPHSQRVRTLLAVI